MSLGQTLLADLLKRKPTKPLPSSKDVAGPSEADRFLGNQPKATSKDFPSVKARERTGASVGRPQSVAQSRAMNPNTLEWAGRQLDSRLGSALSPRSRSLAMSYIWALNNGPDSVRADGRAMADHVQHVIETIAKPGGFEHMKKVVEAYRQQRDELGGKATSNGVLAGKPKFGDVSHDRNTYSKFFKLGKPEGVTDEEHAEVQERLANAVLALEQRKKKFPEGTDPETMRKMDPVIRDIEQYVDTIKGVSAAPWQLRAAANGVYPWMIDDEDSKVQEFHNKVIERVLERQGATAELEMRRQARAAGEMYSLQDLDDALKTQDLELLRVGDLKLSANRNVVRSFAGTERFNKYWATKSDGQLVWESITYAVNPITPIYMAYFGGGRALDEWTPEERAGVDVGNFVVQMALAGALSGALHTQLAGKAATFSALESAFGAARSSKVVRNLQVLDRIMQPLAGYAPEFVAMDLPEFMKMIDDNGGDVLKAAQLFGGQIVEGLNPNLYIDPKKGIDEKVSGAIMGFTGIMMGASAMRGARSIVGNALAYGNRRAVRVGTAAVDQLRGADIQGGFITGLEGDTVNLLLPNLDQMSDGEKSVVRKTAENLRKLTTTDEKTGKETNLFNRFTTNWHASNRLSKIWRALAEKSDRTFTADELKLMDDMAVVQSFDAKTRDFLIGLPDFKKLISASKGDETPAPNNLINHDENATPIIPEDVTSGLTSAAAGVPAGSTAEAQAQEQVLPDAVPGVSPDLAVPAQQMDVVQPADAGRGPGTALDDAGATGSVGGQLGGVAATAGRGPNVELDESFSLQPYEDPTKSFSREYQAFTEEDLQRTGFRWTQDETDGPDGIEQWDVPYGGKLLSAPPRRGDPEVPGMKHYAVLDAEGKATYLGYLEEDDVWPAIQQWEGFAEDYGRQLAESREEDLKSVLADLKDHTAFEAIVYDASEDAENYNSIKKRWQSTDEPFKVTSDPKMNVPRVEIPRRISADDLHRLMQRATPKGRQSGLGKQGYFSHATMSWSFSSLDAAQDFADWANENIGPKPAPAETKPEPKPWEMTADDASALERDGSFVNPDGIKIYRSGNGKDMRAEVWDADSKTFRLLGKWQDGDPVPVKEISDRLARLDGKNLKSDNRNVTRPEHRKASVAKYYVRLNPDGEINWEGSGPIDNVSRGVVHIGGEDSIKAWFSVQVDSASAMVPSYTEAQWKSAIDSALRRQISIPERVLNHYEALLNSNAEPKPEPKPEPQSATEAQYKVETFMHSRDGEKYVVKIGDARLSKGQYDLARGKSISLKGGYSSSQKGFSFKNRQNAEKMAEYLNVLTAKDPRAKNEELKQQEAASQASGQQQVEYDSPKAMIEALLKAKMETAGADVLDRNSPVGRNARSEAFDKVRQAFPWVNDWSDIERGKPRDTAPQQPKANQGESDLSEIGNKVLEGVGGLSIRVTQTGSGRSRVTRRYIVDNITGAVLTGGEYNLHNAASTLVKKLIGDTPYRTDAELRDAISLARKRLEEARRDFRQRNPSVPGAPTPTGSLRFPDVATQQAPKGDSNRSTPIGTNATGVKIYVDEKGGRYMAVGSSNMFEPDGADHGLIEPRTPESGFWVESVDAEGFDERAPRFKIVQDTIDAIAELPAIQNAIRNSDKQNALIEINVQFSKALSDQLLSVVRSDRSDKVKSVIRAQFDYLGTPQGKRAKGAIAEGAYRDFKQDIANADAFDPAKPIVEEDAPAPKEPRTLETLPDSDLGREVIKRVSQNGAARGVVLEESNSEQAVITYLTDVVQNTVAEIEMASPQDDDFLRMAVAPDGSRVLAKKIFDAVRAEDAAPKASAQSDPPKAATRPEDVDRSAGQRFDDPRIQKIWETYFDDLIGAQYGAFDAQLANARAKGTSDADLAQALTTNLNKLRDQYTTQFKKLLNVPTQDDATMGDLLDLLRPDNRHSRKAFERIHSVKLPKSNTETQAAVNAMAGTDAAISQSDKRPDAPIGKNPEGLDIFEDDKGMRYYVAPSGVRHTEPVRMNITRAGINPAPMPLDQKPMDFLTEAERADRIRASNEKAGMSPEARAEADAAKLREQQQAAADQALAETKAETAAEVKTGGLSTFLAAQKEANKARLAQAEEARAKQRQRPNKQSGGVYITPEDIEWAWRSALDFTLEGIMSFEAALRRFFDDLNFDDESKAKTTDAIRQYFDTLEQSGREEFFAHDATTKEVYESATRGVRADGQGDAASIEPGDLSQVGVERGAEQLGQDARPAGREDGEAAQAGEPGDVPAGDQRGDPQNGSDRRGRFDRENVTPENVSERNYRPADLATIAPDTQGKRTSALFASIEALREVQRTGYATPEQLAAIARFPGWGWTGNSLHTDNANPGSTHFKFYSQVRATLTDAQYKSARQATRNSHFTDPRVTSAIWDGIAATGLPTDQIIDALEPSAGIGYFLMSSPKNVRWQMAELNDLTADIAGVLHPDAALHRGKFEDLKYRNPYDIAISNVPFGNYDVRDHWLMMQEGYEHKFLYSSIHNYFIAKMLYQTAPGGAVVAITSRFTMDGRTAEHTAFREWLAERADLVMALRLPSNAFKGNAATDVVTDLLILRKKVPGEAPPEYSIPFTGLKDVEIYFRSGNTYGRTMHPINQVFVDHPEWAIGQHTGEGKMANKKRLPKQKPKETDAEYEARIAPLIEKDPDIKNAYEYTMVDRGGFMKKFTEQLAALPKGFITPRKDLAAPPQTDAPEQANDLRHGTIYRDKGDGMFYVHQVDGQRIPVPEDQSDNMESFLSVRDAYRDLIDGMKASVSDAELGKLQKALRRAYDRYVTDHGPLNSETNKAKALLWREHDPMAWGVRALENWSTKDKEVTSLADIFTKRVIGQDPLAGAKIETAQDALAAAITATAKVDLDFMSEIYGKSRESILEELKGEVFYDFAAGEHVLPNVFLQGNIKRKLQAAEANGDTVAAEFLRGYLPPDKGIGDIQVPMGAPWVGVDTYTKFLQHLLGNTAEGRIEYSSMVGKYQVSSGGLKYSAAATKQWGTSRRNAAELLESLLNRTKVEVRDREGNIDVDATDEANLKREEIQSEFERWRTSNFEVAETLVQRFNDGINVYAVGEPPEPSFPMRGVSEIAKERQHRAVALHRAFSRQGTLLAHDMGTGKTMTAAAFAVEGRRTGLFAKPWIVARNGTLQQSAIEFLQAAPGSNILVADEKNFDAANRKRFLAQAANGDYDAVIITHTAFERIAMSGEFYDRFYGDLEQLGINSMIASESNFTVKQIETMLEKIKTKIDKKRSGQKAGDNALFFDDLGIDAIVVDEAHNFKNLWSPVPVEGAPNTHAERSLDMLMKLDFVRQNPKSKVVMMTGTPISNSIMEAYTMQRFVAPELLTEMGIENAAQWASIFGEVVTEMEQTATGAWKNKSRFSKFGNLGELVGMTRQFMHVVFPEDIITVDSKTGNVKRGLTLPESVDLDGKSNSGFIVEESRPTFEQSVYFRYLAIRARSLPRTFKPEKGADNILVISSDGRKAALDLRLVDPNAPDDPGSKINKAVANIVKVYKQYAKDKGTQLVFLDMGVPKKGSGKKASDSDASAEEGDGEKFLTGSDRDEVGMIDLYADIKKKLVKQGIKPEEIAFIQDYTETKLRQLLADVRAGKVRVLIGHTQRMSEGLNVQDRLVALHHLSPGWKPATLMQAMARMFRPGNMFKKVHNFQYVATDSYDSVMWSTQLRKMKAIDSFMRWKPGDDTVVEDIGDASDRFSLEMITAIASGDPRVGEYMNLNNQVGLLQRKQAAHERGVSTLAHSRERYMRDAKSLEREIDNVTRDLAVIPESIEVPTGDGKTTGKHQEIGKYFFFESKGKSAWELSTGRIGNIVQLADGSKLKATLVRSTETGDVLAAVRVEIPGKLNMLVATSLTEEAFAEDLWDRTMTSLGGKIAQMRTKALGDLNAAQKRLSAVSADMAAVETALKTPSPHLAELSKARARRDQLAEELGLKQDPEKKGQESETQRTFGDSVLDDEQKSKAQALAEELFRKGRGKHVDFSTLESDMNQRAKQNNKGDDDSGEDGPDIPPEVLAITATKPGDSRIPVAPFPQDDQPLMSAEDIADMVEERLNKKVWRAKQSRGSMAGSFNAHSKAITLVNRGNIYALTHELGRHLDDAFGLVPGIPIATTKAGAPSKRGRTVLDAELFMLAQPYTAKSDTALTRRKEAMAAAINAYMLNPEVLEAVAPETYAYIRKHLAPLLGDLREIGDQARRLAGASAIDRGATRIIMRQPKEPAIKKMMDAVRSAVGKGEETIPGLAFATKFSYNWTDELAPIEAIVKEAQRRKGQTLDDLLPDEDPVGLARDLYYHQGKLEQTLTDGIYSADGHKISEGIASIIEPLMEDGVTDQQLEDRLRTSLLYGISELHLERAKRIVEQAQDQSEVARAEGDDEKADKILEQAYDDISRMTGLGSGIVSDVDAAIQIITEASKDQKMLAKIKESNRAYRQIANAMLQYAVEKGRMSREQVDAITGANEHYIAMQRFLDDAAGTGYHTQSGVTGGPKMGKARNNWLKKFKGSQRPIQSPFVNLMEQISAAMREIDTNEAERSFIDVLQPSAQQQMYGGIDLSDIAIKVPNSMEMAGKPIVKIYRGGKEERWMLDKDVYKSLKSAGSMMNHVNALKYVRSVTRFTRQAITSSPRFIVRNFVRDQAGRMLIGTAHKGNAKLTNWRLATKEELAEYERYGGGIMEYDLTDNAQSFYEVQRRVIDEMVNGKKLGYKLMHPKQWWHLWLRTAAQPEIFNRIQEYRAAKQEAYSKGYNEQQARLYAARKSRDLMDFLRAGAFIRQLNQYVPFLNAGIQGKTRFIREVRNNPRRLALRVLLQHVMPSLAMYYIAQSQGEEEEREYMNQPLYMRSLFYMIKIGDTWYTVPKPFEASIISSGVEHLVHAARGEYEADALESLYQQGKVAEATDVLAPVEPILEVAYNQDWFRKKAIIPQSEAELAVELREGTDRASKAGQWLMKITGYKIDSRHWDHLIEGYLGNWGRLGLTAVPSDDRRSMQTWRTWANAATGFVTETPGYNARSTQRVLALAKSVGVRGVLGYEIEATFNPALTDAEREEAKRVLVQRAEAIIEEIENATKGYTGAERLEVIKEVLEYSGTK